MSATVDAVTVHQAEALPRARWRLRDLRGPDRALAIVRFALLLVPFVTGIVRA